MNRPYVKGMDELISNLQDPISIDEISHKKVQKTGEKIGFWEKLSP